MASIRNQNLIWKQMEPEEGYKKLKNNTFLIRESRVPGFLTIDVNLNHKIGSYRISLQREENKFVWKDANKELKEIAQLAKTMTPTSANLSDPSALKSLEAIVKKILTSVGFPFISSAILANMVLPDEHNFSLTYSHYLTDTTSFGTTLASSVEAKTVAPASTHTHVAKSMSRRPNHLSVVTSAASAMVTSLSDNEDAHWRPVANRVGVPDVWEKEMNKLLKEMADMTTPSPRSPGLR